MPDGIATFTLAQIVIPAAAGIFGVGAGWAALRSSVKQMHRDIRRLKQHDNLIFGAPESPNPGEPAFVRRSECLQHHDGLIRKVKALENFARWQLQKEGLGPDEVARILNGGQ